MTATVEIRPHARGAVVPVRAQPGARQDAVLGVHAGALKLSVTAPPEGGRANEALRRLLAGWLGLRPGDVELLRGATSRDKQFLVRGWDAAALRDRIAGRGTS